MAGPTVNQIIKQRDAAMNTCEETSKTERAKIESSSTLNLSTLEYIKGLFSFGPSGLRTSLIVPIEANEKVCKHKTLMDADVAFATREGALMVEKAGLEGLAEGRNIALAGADRVVEIYKQAFTKTRIRAEVAEAVAAECLKQLEPKPLAPKRQNPSLLLAAKR